MYLKFYTFCTLLVIFCHELPAQVVPFRTFDSLNINNINARVLVNGELWCDSLNDFYHGGRCTFPADSISRNLSAGASLWMSANDAGGQLHISESDYNNQKDFWPGPLDASDTITFTTSQNWAKIWKVNRSDIDYFLTLSSHNVANTPANILTWPGTGNTNAQGNGGVPLTITGNMAPFVDLNGNGIYEPLQGEYPDFPGEQALWWVYSDNGPTHSQTGGLPLGVEVHVLSFGYRRFTLIDNVVYYKFEIINKSAETYNNFRISIFDYNSLYQPYFGYGYVGFDSSLRIGINYSGVQCFGAAGGYPVSGAGCTTPVSGITMIELPGDAGSTLMPAGSFTYYNNDNSIIGNPDSAYQYDNYMRAKLRNGTHFTNDFIGPGIVSKAFGSGPVTNYVFTGDPGNRTQWSECVSDNFPGDRRFVLSSNDFTLLPGQSKEMVMALISTNLDTSNACPYVNFNNIKIVADTAWQVYHNPLTPSSITNPTASNNKISIYPDPAHNQLWVTKTSSVESDASIEIYNTLGQYIKAPILAENTSKVEIDISSLLPGVYTLLYRNNKEQFTTTFVKIK